QIPSISLRLTTAGTGHRPATDLIFSGIRQLCDPFANRVRREAGCPILDRQCPAFRPGRGVRARDPAFWPAPRQSEPRMDISPHRVIGAHERKGAVSWAATSPL